MTPMNKRPPVYLAAFVLLGSILGPSVARSEVIWTGNDMTWSQPDEDSFDNLFDEGEDVIFDGAGEGTITVSHTGGVTPGTFLLTNGTYNFTGDAINADSFTLSGGHLQWNVSNQLGTGTINVTGDTVIEAMSTTTLTMTNPIAVSDGVTLAILQNNTASGASQPTVGAISGGSALNPIRLELTAIAKDGGTHPISLNNFNDAQFGHENNKIKLEGRDGLRISMAANTETTLVRNLELDATHH